MSRSADRALFRRVAAEYYLLVSDPATGDIWCEGCGCWLPPETVPHHRKGAGLGGKRKHTVANMEYRCRPCHDRMHF